MKLVQAIQRWLQLRRAISIHVDGSIVTQEPTSRAVSGKRLLDFGQSQSQLPLSLLQRLHLKT